jgi:hypothetical protein
MLGCRTFAPSPGTGWFGPIAHPPNLEPSCRRGGAPPAVTLDPVDHDRLADDLGDLHPRIKRAVRVLENYLNAPPQRQQLLALGLRYIDPVIEDFPGRRLPAAGCNGRWSSCRSRSRRPVLVSRPAAPRNRCRRRLLRLLFCDATTTPSVTGRCIAAPDFEEGLLVVRGYDHCRYLSSQMVAKS